MPKIIKPSNPFTNVCWVLFLTTFSAPPQILAASTVFFCPIPKRRNDGWWFSFGATAAGLFWTVNVCGGTSCNKQGPAQWQYTFFHGVIPDAFWSSQNRMCEIKQYKQWLRISLLLIFVNVSGAMNRHLCSRINYIHSLTGNFSAGVSGNN